MSPVRDLKSFIVVARELLYDFAKSFVVGRNRFDHATLVECPRAQYISRNRFSSPS